MERFLTMTLQGPLQAWGGHTLETYRPTESFPTRSGLTGLLAAALGIERRDEESLRVLDSSYSYAVREDRFNEEEGGIRPLPPSRKVTDYHTVQNVRTVGGKPKETEVTYREYLEDTKFTVALRQAGPSAYPLGRLANALRAPHFMLFLGRKACPICCPPFKGFVEAESLEDALRQCRPQIGLVYSEEPPSTAQSNLTRLRDVPLGGRSFAERNVYFYNMEGE